MRRNPGQVISDYVFNEIFGRAWGRAMTIPNAIAAFQTTGIYPFSRTAVKTIDSVESHRQSTGLHFLPVLSPAPARKKSATATSRDEEGADLNKENELENLMLNDVPPVQSVISKFFPDCRPVTQPPQFYEKACATVLTGAEYKKKMEEKEKLKREKEQQLKTGRKRERKEL